MQTKLKAKIKENIWIYCSGHAGVRGNGMADHLVGRAAANDRFSIDKKAIIKAILSKLKGQEDTDIEGRMHHQRLLEREMMK